MAESRVITHPWDKGYSEEGLQTVGENETLHDALMDNASQLSKSMNLSDTFWSLLVQRGVVDDGVKDKILAAKTVRAQAMALVQHLLTLEVYKLHGFVWALVNSNQCHMAELLGFSVDDYLDMDVFMKYSSFCCPACSEFYTKAYILTGCGHYICAPCAKGAQFLCKDNKKEDVTCPVPDCGKTSETSPSEESLGLDEDVAFKDLCDIFVKRFSENREYAMKNTEKAELKDNNVDKVNLQIAKLKEKAARLEKFTKNLAEQETTLKDHIREEQEKIKQSADDWAEKNLKVYADVEHQAHSKLHQSLQWEKIASELSIFLRTQPWLSEIGQTMEDVLTKEADSPIPKNTLMKDLDSGQSILTIVSPYELKETAPVAVRPAGADKCGSQKDSSQSVPKPVVKPPDAGPAPPTKSKSKANKCCSQPEPSQSVPRPVKPPDAGPAPPTKGDKFGSQEEPPKSVPRPVKPPDVRPAPPTRAKCLAGSIMSATKLAWTSEDDLLVLTAEGVYQMIIHTESSTTNSVQILEKTWFQDMGCTPRSVILTQLYVKRYQHKLIFELTKGKCSERKLQKVNRPYRVFINSQNIYVLGEGSRRVYRFDLNYNYEGYYDVGSSFLAPITGYIHVTEKGSLLVSAPTEDRIYMTDIKTKTTSHFSRTGGKPDHLKSPQGVCSVNNGEHILVCDTGNDRVCVFSHGGTYLHDLDIRYGSRSPTCIAVLARPGKPTLLALSLTIKKDGKSAQVLDVYSLE